MIAPLLACDRSEKIAPPAQPLNTPALAGQGELVELTQLDPSIRLDIRYATANNFTGRQLYDQPRAFLVRSAAEALARAQKVAAAEGYGLTIFDAYRPWRITKALWDATPPGPQRNYVANPKKGSKHNRGCAVDLSLHQLETGELVEMPSGYDEFTQRAHRDFMAAAPEAIANRVRLERWMEAQGFRGISNEWWHFDFNGWEDFPILDIAFEEIG
ncbi:D-alanyl-D-alanine dipeptidase [Sphingorhabdus pulchriflava]|uniref:D-alanyl-D-alanine dipeptidase n=1 Tax=Sphingorhabdus pulchriflava TaxID=2292257 RepID=A0A371BF69_9SPHN|nr:D-alanyl-D-alanine dipeptidase [Sphingorhabdus pulchriflava]